MVLNYEPTLIILFNIIALTLSFTAKRVCLDNGKAYEVGQNWTLPDCIFAICTADLKVAAMPYGYICLINRNYHIHFGLFVPFIADAD